MRSQSRVFEKAVEFRAYNKKLCASVPLCLK